MTTQEKPTNQFAILEYISHLVLVRGMLEKADFPSLTPEEEKILQNIAINCCLEFEISLGDLFWAMPKLHPHNIDQGLKNLIEKGFVYLEPADEKESKEQQKRNRLIKLTQMALNYFSQHGECISQLATRKVR
jgi:hypothetical protein